MLNSESPYLEPAVFVGTSKNLWLTAGRDLWHFDGRHWKRIEVPFAGRVKAGKVSQFNAARGLGGGA